MNTEQLTAIIVDDEAEAIKNLEALLKAHHQVDVCGTFQKPEEAIGEIQNHEPDLLFLDVQMPGKTGFDVLKEVSGSLYQPIVIFTTAYEKYAIEAIRLAAFDFLLKPISEEELAHALQRIEEKQEQPDYSQKLQSLFRAIDKPKQLKFNTSTGFILIDPREILYCQASRNYCELFLNNGEREVVTCNMNRVGKMLPDDRFFRISRFNIINLDYLKKVERKDHSCTLLADGEKIVLKGTPKNLKVLEEKLSSS
ncbi:MAG: LytTR family DNA-binding domain-containing protein [Bacteroidales bacterium]|nr:LytTR family DNA-binding domain-containing protein [Bacteroidales bacterium]MCF8343533.1 LytTR family DNA-binding domain-containing protein [Bacteroidales bacterium]MCF8349824.1 LytTR family DNA-binding domain-containing protein [Bacteroidales bacterium]MCF8375944.1 LytTR family DNA-binding domain-containing protein [Bacteroidales bacterium]